MAGLNTDYPQEQDSLYICPVNDRNYDVHTSETFRAYELQPKTSDREPKVVSCDILNCIHGDMYCRTSNNTLYNMHDDEHLVVSKFNEKKLSTLSYFQNMQTSPAGDGDSLNYDEIGYVASTSNKTTINLSDTQGRWSNETLHNESTVASLSPIDANVEFACQLYAR